ncbi:MAG: thiosulfate oxidation carrier complex protein SoxZ [Alphaproteobacteria bacterium]
MALARARVSMPDTAQPGEIITVKTLIRHPMETGYRLDSRGRSIPRHIITRLTAVYAGTEVFRMDFTQGVAANPFVAFTLRAQETGDLVCTWEDDLGETTTVTKTLTVDP